MQMLKKAQRHKGTKGRIFPGPVRNRFLNRLSVARVILFVTLAIMAAGRLEAFYIEEAQTLLKGESSTDIGIEYVHYKEAQSTPLLESRTYGILDYWEDHFALYCGSNYGLLDRWQVGFLVNALARNNGRANNYTGLGDLKLMTRVMLLEEKEVLPTVSLGGGVKYPLGEEERGLSTGKKDYFVRLLLGKEWKMLALYLNLTYYDIGHPKWLILPDYKEHLLRAGPSDYREPEMARGRHIDLKDNVLAYSASARLALVEDELYLIGQILGNENPLETEKDNPMVGLVGLRLNFVGGSGFIEFSAGKAIDSNVAPDSIFNLCLAYQF